jgi:hypothetical protein
MSDSTPDSLHLPTMNHYLGHAHTDEGFPGDSSYGDGNSHRRGGPYGKGILYRRGNYYGIESLKLV